MLNFLANLTQEDRPILVAVLGRNVVGIDRNTGLVKWQSELPTAALTDLLVGKDHVYIIQDETLFCYTYPAGQLVGTVNLPFERKTERPRMVLDGDQLFIADSWCFVCLTLDGRIQWQNTDMRAVGQKAPFGFPGNVSVPDYT